MIVVDTNILAYLYLPGDRTEEVKSLLEADSEWAAPVLWRSELTNILCTCMRVKGLAKDRCLEIFELADELMRERTYSTSPLRVFEVAERTACSGYDSEFIALAEDLQTKLVTYDAALLSRAGPIACAPSDIEARDNR
jgi:predicted nucleic acid-binding protein